MGALCVFERGRGDVMLDKRDITVDMLRRSCDRKGYKFFESGDYNLNIIGIRTADRGANTFNDYLCVAFKQSGAWVVMTFACTTDPGVYWRLNPMNDLGTAVLVPGQYSAAYMLGLHKSKYNALVQAKALPVYRDNNRDASVDMDGVVDVGWHGINIHPRNDESKSDDIGKWSAGCQVSADYNEHMLLIHLCELAKDRWGNRFTYTLFEESDLL
jgi:hypothetical protein